MKNRFRLFRRHGVFYAHDNETGKQESLRTRDRKAAERLFHAKNEAFVQPAINLQIARGYLMASDPLFSKRTWQHVMGEITKTKEGSTRERYERAMLDKSFAPIRDKTLISTRGEDLLDVLENGTVATNIFLRRLHNFALDFDWIPHAIIPKRQWPPVRFREKRAITLEEHKKIVARERIPERKAFYELCWHLGGSQSDVANLKAGDIDWENTVVSFFRQKTGSAQIIHFGPTLESLLKTLPQQGLLLPNVARTDSKHRSSFFQMICRRLSIEGISLHSYRYAWAERAQAAGMPERFAMAMLGHNSPAIHRVYAKKAQVRIPSLEDYESKVIPMPKAEAV